MKRILFSLYLSSLVLFAYGQHITLTPQSYSSEQSSTVPNFSLKGINAIDFIATRHSGTLDAPAATVANLSILEIGAGGYNGRGFTGVKSKIQMIPSENWTPTANGIGIQFATTANGSTSMETRMTIAHDGNIGIGTTSPKTKHHIFNNSSGVTPHSYTKLFVEDNASTFIGIGVPDGSESGIVFGNPTGSSAKGGVIMEGDGTLKLRAGSATRMTINNDGSVDFGNFATFDNNGLYLKEGAFSAWGDTSVEDIYLVGCIVGPFNVTLLGNCRIHPTAISNVKPFSSVLNQFAKLQPVDFNWKADKFPQKDFGDEQSYGLIAQEVEKIFPDLVVKDKEGYLKVNYSKLPMLSIQAIKELKSKNDELRTAIFGLKEEIRYLKYWAAKRK